VAAAFLAAYAVREALSFLLKKPLFPLSTYAGFMAFTVAVALLFLAFFGLYRKRHGADWADELVDVGKALSIACVVIMASTFVLYLRDFSRVVIVSFWPISIGAVTVMRTLLRRATAAAWASGFGARRVLVLGGADSRAELEVACWVASLTTNG
jgi:FlaA1/EpsC-like NDP-sugar epimerase